MRALHCMVLLLAVGCDKQTTPLQSNPGARVTQGARVELNATDGTLIVGDAWLQPDAAPGVVFLHMTPRGPWVRTDWPAPLMESLHAQGLSVIRIDRRGAGESGGEPTDAFEGPAGRTDVEAAVRYLSDNGLTTLGVVGASNGSTSAIDYAVWAEGEGLPAVSAMALMSPGTYTENQTAASAVGSIPTLVMYPQAEASWPDSIRDDVSAWQFTEYPGTSHGTQLFADDAPVADDLSAFLVETLLP